ncbi:hypothetical protein BDA99DRAFT_534175 [Phascolomyces articulosus]|uniref:Uncharacterized protein n=1 Tax=Phascolomyces articulosus TaxID=60185 RepID=A0AAD5PH20_9FUNG|nr:hypothetical protein BDA99DRAFT_534175 [Phascolomyces articulosus]
MNCLLAFQVSFAYSQNLNLDPRNLTEKFVHAGNNGLVSNTKILSCIKFMLQIFSFIFPKLQRQQSTQNNCTVFHRCILRTFITSFSSRLLLLLGVKCAIMIKEQRSRKSSKLLHELNYTKSVWWTKKRVGKVGYPTFCLRGFYRGAYLCTQNFREQILS